MEGCGWIHKQTDKITKKDTLCARENQHLKQAFFFCTVISFEPVLEAFRFFKKCPERGRKKKEDLYLFLHEILNYQLRDKSHFCQFHFISVNLKKKDFIFLEKKLDTCEKKKSLDLRILLHELECKKKKKKKE